MAVKNALQPLAAFDPELERSLTEARRVSGIALDDADLAGVVDTIFLSYGREINLGAAVADGYRRLFFGDAPEAVESFTREIRQAATRSVGLARNLANLLPQVLLSRETGLWETFHETLPILLSKGEYLIKAPLEGLAPLTSSPDGSAKAYLKLLQAVFGQTLSYNRCQYLGNLLPRAVGQLKISSGRTAQIRQMIRLIRIDLDLLEPYLEGLSTGLELLSPRALQQFVDQALENTRGDPQTLRRFLALRSGQGRNACRCLQTAVTLNDLLPRLNRYFRARTGQTGRIRPMSALHKRLDCEMTTLTQSLTDGVHLYLPDVVDEIPNRGDNEKLLTTLAKFEAGLIEFGTFSFDLQRARDMGCLAGRPKEETEAALSGASDFTFFGRRFENPRLALDLLTVFEHARIRVLLAKTYPGLLRSGLPLYQSAMRTKLAAPAQSSFLDICYGCLALDLPAASIVPHDSDRDNLLKAIVDAFANCNPATMRVEHAAGLVEKFYDRVQNVCPAGSLKAPFTPIFRMPLQPDLIDAASHQADTEARRLAKRLEGCGVKLYRGDLRHLLQQGTGRLTAEDIVKLACPLSDGPTENDSTFDPATRDKLPADVVRAEGLVDDLKDAEDIDRITWLKEWNAGIGDYLHDHVRVRDRRLGGKDTTFYTDVLDRCDALVRRVRRSFELLRPEGIGILRQWLEGDDFDWRALLDYVIDRKAGRQPSERLYIKRIKQRRDVAVMLLVDLSRSTSNIVIESQRSVLDVAKEAIVLFTQALEVVGDSYAVAGFSGTGRLGVDFFRIKDFHESLNAYVKGTISALTPQRSTRMGAAVRRATLELMAQDNRVRLLLLIGDGFPNDTEYKNDYAVQDTRQAIAEACSNGIVTQAITVNLPASPRLDQLYGPVRHTVISDVNELPDKLLRLYGRLTRS